MTTVYASLRVPWGLLDEMPMGADPRPWVQHTLLNGLPVSVEEKGFFGL